MKRGGDYDSVGLRVQYSVKNSGSFSVSK